MKSLEEQLRIALLRVGELEDALRPFATAGWRIAYYGVNSPPDRVVAHDSENNSTTELYAVIFEDGKWHGRALNKPAEEELLTTDHLIAAAAVMQGR